MNKSLVGVVAVLAVIVLSGCDLFKGQQALWACCPRGLGRAEGVARSSRRG
jgi:hypothetical protein